jgi:hypothetical protein
MIWNHAQQGIFLLDEHYRTQYTCRYQPVLQMFSVLHLTDTIARFFPGGMEGDGKDGPEALQFGMEALMQSQPGFPVAGPLLELLRRTANECSIRLRHTPTVATGIQRLPKLVYGMDDFVDACTHPTYRIPVDEILSRYVASFASEWITEGPLFGLQEPVSGVRSFRVPSIEERGAQNLMQIRNLLNAN